MHHDDHGSTAGDAPGLVRPRPGSATAAIVTLFQAVVPVAMTTLGVVSPLHGLRWTPLMPVVSAGPGLLRGAARRFAARHAPVAIAGA